jgi:hypothetical protein
MVEWVYPRSERESDAILARGDEGAEKGAPQESLPVAPENVNPAGWAPMPPVNETGKPWSRSDWAATLQKLINNLSDEFKAAFSEKFHLNADDVLAQLKKPEAVSPATSPVAPPAGSRAFRNEDPGGRRRNSGTASALVARDGGALAYFKILRQEINGR